MGVKRMTEKQYTKVNMNLELNGKTYYNIKRRSDGFNICQVYGKYTADGILKELNDLHEKNQRLEKEKLDLSIYNQENEISALKEINKFKKENEELKRQIGKQQEEIEIITEENDQLKTDNDIKFWKHEFMSQWNTTEIITHELYLAIENGYEISEDFKKYLDELKERHEENMKKAERLKI